MVQENPSPRYRRGGSGYPVISFWVNRAGAFGMENYLLDRGKALAPHLKVQLYNWRPTIVATPGPQIFAALDQLSPMEIVGAAAWRHQLATLDPTAPLLNDPSRSLVRYQLLERLADAGLNSFRAYRVDRGEPVCRFPVFVRENLGHNGTLTTLLASHKELRRAIRALKLRGFRRRNLLIVEFCDTSDSIGIFRKYAAFRVGKTIIPAHIMRGKDWSLKHDSSETTREMLEEELAYHERNPYRDWLQTVFSLAGIEYGRIDFGVLGGRPQAWEINTNPTIGRNPHRPPRELPPEIRELRKHTRDVFHERMRQAFTALDEGREKGRSLELQLNPTLVRHIERETRKMAREQRMLDALQRTYHGSLGRPLRAMMRRYFPWPTKTGKSRSAETS